LNPNQSAAPIKPLLIDMDGTLVDSTAVVEKTWSDFAQRHGLDAAEVIRFAHGRPTTATTHKFLGDPWSSRTSTWVGMWPGVAFGGRGASRSARLPHCELFLDDMEAT